MEEKLREAIFKALSYSAGYTNFFFNRKPFLVGHIGPNLMLNTLSIPFLNTFLAILVRRMTLKKKPPPLPILTRIDNESKSHKAEIIVEASNLMSDLSYCFLKSRVVRFNKD